MTVTLPSVYSPQEVERKWYKYWEENGFFHTEPDEREPFCIVMPPPNVTGQLHMGHALDNTMQDILARYKRMQGFNTLWLPGTDHAGIATQAKVEEELRKEGLTKDDLGREKFLERVWAWKENYGNRITEQLRTLGASCDWKRERFTLDEGCSEAVKEVFLRLYEKGLIYRDYYITNWCPHCKTTISDIEVEHLEREGKLYYINYPLEDGSGYLTVATTRPETMLGDTAVAVHPEDERYRELIGKNVILPLVNRPIPVIADEYVDKEFGTGAVKITPAHDPNDFEVGLRHKLPQVVVLDDDAVMNENAGKYRGLDRYEARKKIVEDLKDLGLLVKEEEITHSVGHCYRCDTVIEPRLSKQWFVKMKPLAEPAIEAALTGKVKFVPERFTKIYLNWLYNIRDWCISRQLWWGHRIPVWYCDECGEVIPSREEVKSCPKCQSTKVHQDPDVLDTWFSSALWPFSTLGWPQNTEELKYYYPTSVLVTGRDIIFFWVARMLFMGLEFMKEVPFKEVLIHGLVLDAQGRKMSKSLGNGVDPVEVIASHGADSLRFMLVTGNTPGNDLRFHFERLDGARNFANKLWNASRFVLMNLEGFTPQGIKQEELTLADRWILARLNAVIDRVTAFLDEYELGEAARELYEFIWDEFCDWYVELTKPRLYGKMPGGDTAREVLYAVLKTTLELLHPFMPFITEEIWQRLPHEGKTIMLAPWPKGRADYENPEAVKQMSSLMEVIREIRRLRAEVNVPPAKRGEVILVTADEQLTRLLNENAWAIAALAQSEPRVVPKMEVPQGALTGVAAGVTIYLPLKDLIDLEKEKERLNKELKKVLAEIERLNQKLNNPGFLAKAPAEVVNKEREKLTAFYREKEVLEQRIGMLSHEL
ncbi:valine--tRNA ligase [Carboxydothermus hydrogenoformans]|uniref:Valine--tRNA ligase n=1 Tax=Carboxydothermus hydrogenoformans (strain ATCC BAA-161 / DSM 6008 / Z-2901) TaxID=246194 RepID=SYV_CARHZ|nr:valine--tRNA ligase [Carboxydothermus hydrogenoformans]Q3AF87.1 RecName: Full=Valine--tRNA ligase; AltName: Full=Valyl-tRNA synthetase; Short=ValRS [Carboxydothermus hydrogenoformans Z-2901]ABB15424.1 valyl-tRNA synthetase [Carboxydothermus hydrogenoformans Z-2901]